MNETTGQTSSCLAIAETKAHKPGGCVGIFFQLFDWNRRFAKKKIFSKRLLPPARAKQASKKFGGDEKMPKTKLQLIADENSGGFPNVKKNGNRNSLDIIEHKHEMRVPGLVARLMGLESMPISHRDRHKKAPYSGSYDKEEELVMSGCRLHREDLNSGKGSVKVESRPQKLKKTGQFERRAVTKFRPEALQIKGVLSRSRKHNGFVPPVKSPRISSTSNASRASRLIDAATRILEPGLQARNRARCALTYPSSMNYTPGDELLPKGMQIMAPDIVNQQYQQHNDIDNVGAGKSLMVQTSCKNCGNMLDVVDSRPEVEEQPYIYPSSVPNLVNNSPQASEINPRPPISSTEKERNIIYRRFGDQPPTVAEILDNTRSYSESITERMPMCQKDQTQRQFRSQRWRALRDEPCSIAFKQRAQVQNEISLGRDRFPPRAKKTNLQNRRVSAANVTSGARDFVSLNRSLSGCSRPRVTTKADNSATGTERKFCSRIDDSLSHLSSPVQERRKLSLNAQIGSSAFDTGQRSSTCNIVSGREFGLNVHSMDHKGIKNRLAGQGEGKRVCGFKDNDAISFTFNSPMQQQAFVSTELKAKRNQIDKNAFHQRNLKLGENNDRTSLCKQLLLRGDVLGIFLEQKLKELTLQKENELAIRGATSNRSSGMILQELVSVLTAPESICPAGASVADSAIQTGRQVEGSSVGFSYDHLSPGSVLEATFSNGSRISSSLDGNSGPRLLSDHTDDYYYHPQSIENDVDLLDSANSRNKGRTGRILVTDLLNHISRILQSINLAGGGLDGSKLAYAKDVILNAELLFGSMTAHTSHRMKRFLIGPFLLGELENLANAMWINLHCLLGFEESKEGNQLRRFLLDCVIECLDSKYSQHCNSGFKAWKRVASCMNSDLLIQDIEKEVRRWTSFVGMIPDEIIEWEMSHSLGKWTDFEIETFESGFEIDLDILQILIQEIVEDLWL